MAGVLTTEEVARRATILDKILNWAKKNPAKSKREIIEAAENSGVNFDDASRTVEKLINSGGLEKVGVKDRVEGQKGRCASVYSA